MMPYLFTPPTRRVPVRSRDPFWRRMKDDVGRTVLKHGPLVYETVDGPTAEQVDAAELTYLGGHTYYISDAEAADLTAAGYGDFLVQPPVSSGTYGSGTYGDGAYGAGAAASTTPDPVLRVYGAGPYGTGTYDGRG